MQMIGFKYIIYSQILLLALTSCENQQPVKKLDFDGKCEQLVLSENKIGQEYLFKVISKKEILEYYITYLGEIENKSISKIKFLNCVVYTGLYEDSKRASGAVILYNSNNDFLGMYQIGGASAVPSKVEGSNLVFSYNDESCDQTTSINFLDSIPKQIFINCSKDGGDLYSFTKE
jgi:hypothetical protein